MGQPSLCLIGNCITPKLIDIFLCLKPLHKIHIRKRLVDEASPFGERREWGGLFHSGEPCNAPKGSYQYNYH